MSVLTGAGQVSGPCKTSGEPDVGLRSKLPMAQPPEKNVQLKGSIERLYADYSSVFKLGNLCKTFCGVCGSRFGLGYKATFLSQ